VALISTGMMTPRAKGAVELLRSQGISVRHLHMATVKPLDLEAVRDAALSIGSIVTVENHSVIGGLGGAVCEAVAETAPCRVRRLGYRDIFLEGGDDEVLFGQYGLTAETIARAVTDFL